ncbi:hypothetical protein FXO38_24815 [Capsicum annuum]|nr:hypothetical protein FXO38_24815 [Capsicum annuum]
MDNGEDVAAVEIVEEEGVISINSTMKIKITKHSVVVVMDNEENRKDQTPQEAWSRRKLSAKHLRIFGSITYAHVPHQGRDKLDDRSVRSHGIGRARRLRKKIYDFLSYFEDEEEKDTVTLVQDATPPLSPGNIASPSSQDQSSSERSQRMESIQELYDGIEEVTNFDFLCCLFADSESMNFNKVVTDKR